MVVWEGRDRNRDWLAGVELRRVVCRAVPLWGKEKEREREIGEKWGMGGRERLGRGGGKGWLLNTHCCIMQDCVLFCLPSLSVCLCFRRMTDTTHQGLWNHRHTD